MPTPRVSILIPNFNNGRASSKDGQTDLIGDLLVSLRETLRDDPTPFEVIAYDDGSDDDSLETLRQWAGDGFLRLIEAEHCGVLARTANRLVEASSGDILVRLDGDITVLTPNWAEKLTAVFDHGPAELGVVGPKQLAHVGPIVHGFGDFILHPKGYHHHLQGSHRDEIRRPAEVDHVMGCFYCCRRAVHDRLGGYDEDVLRGQTIEFGLRARLAGFRCIAVPNIEFRHRHSLRGRRSNVADTDDAVLRSRETFRAKWGFDRLGPDLDAVRERYAGTPLLWNAEVFGLPGAAQYALAAGPEPSVETSAWKRFGEDAAFRQSVQQRVAQVGRIAAGVAPAGRAARVGLIGDRLGLAAHLLAAGGLDVSSIDPNPAYVGLGGRFLASPAHAGRTGSAELIHQPDPARLPWADASMDLVVWLDGLERHPNPTAVLADAGRVLRPEAVFALSAPPTEYLPHEAAVRVRSAGSWWVPMPGPTASADQPTVVLAAP
ncbi:MAG: glycosyltransferase, partial [Planctomycetota bacterium]